MTTKTPKIDSDALARRVAGHSNHQKNAQAAAEHAFREHRLAQITHLEHSAQRVSVVRVDNAQTLVIRPRAFAITSLGTIAVGTVFAIVALSLVYPMGWPIGVGYLLAAAVVGITLTLGLLDRRALHISVTDKGDFVVYRKSPHAPYRGLYGKAARLDLWSWTAGWGPHSPARVCKISMEGNDKGVVVRRINLVEGRTITQFRRDALGHDVEFFLDPMRL